MAAKTTQWGSRKLIIKYCYNLLQENKERKPPLVDMFIGDYRISAYFYRPNFEQLYLPEHLIAKIPIASPSCTKIALSALRWSWKYEM